MDASTLTTRIDDLYQLTLVDGIKTTAGRAEQHYRRVTLRDTDVNDERAAVMLSERVVNVGGQPRLMSSPDEFRLAMNMKHVARLEADGEHVLDGSLLDLDLFGRLTPHDLGLIEQRIFLITLAAQVRYGLISQAEFDNVLAGKSSENKPGPASPQPVGQAAAPGAAAPEPELGPALLADFAGGSADGAPAGHGR